MRVSSGVSCSICGYSINLPGDHDILLDVLMLPHDLITALSGKHRRRGRLWDAAYRRGVVLDHPWTEDEALDRIAAKARSERNQP